MVEKQRNKKNPMEMDNAINDAVYEHIEAECQWFRQVCDDEKALTLWRELLFVFYGSQDGLYIVDANGITVRVNPAFEAITGIAADKFLQKDVRDLEREGYFDRSVATEVLRTGRSATIVQRYKNNRTALVTGTPITDVTGALVRVVSNIRDISELSRLYDDISAKERLIEAYSEVIMRYENIYQEGIIAESKTMKSIIKLMQKIAPMDSNVLLLGESGVGKSLFARLIRRLGENPDCPFINVNCGAIPENLIESELFGYVQGAFTGALTKGKEGLVQSAGGGILFLDEIGQMPLPLQPKLLTFLESKEVMKIGAIRPEKVDARVIAASNVDLEDMVTKNLFRQDLFYRLNVISITIPPLRDRREDIIPLASHFLNELNKKNNTSKKLQKPTSDLLSAYNWPGNIRQLRNVIEKMFVLSTDSELTPEDLPAEILPVRPPYMGVSSIPLPHEGIHLPEVLRDIEERWIDEAMKRCGSIRAAANLLGIPPSTLFSKRNRK